MRVMPERQCGPSVRQSCSFLQCQASVGALSTHPAPSLKWLLPSPPEPLQSTPLAFLLLQLLVSLSEAGVGVESPLQWKADTLIHSRHF